MNTLILRPSLQNLEYAVFQDADRNPLWTGCISDFRSHDNGKNALQEIQQQAQEQLGLWHEEATIDALAIRVPFGGPDFRESVVVTDDVVAKLERLVAQSPLHIPLILSLLQCCEEIFSGLPIVLVFETAFFVDLPAREMYYAIDVELAEQEAIRRYGYHGLYHEAATRYAARLCHDAGMQNAPRVLSICLDPQPEVAAVVGSHPVTVTSGATPLEGIPGHTSCGEIDPSVVIALVENSEWGPERVNRLLTQESGILGLTGERKSLVAVLGSEAGNAATDLARAMLEYRILQACGTGIAAMGGLDCVVFSGRYAAVGNVLGARLKERLALQEEPQEEPAQWEQFQDSLDQIIADHVLESLKRVR